MKCQYQGTWTRTGCNEDAVPGTDYCHAHRDQGPANKVQNNVMGWGCIVSVILVVLIVIFASTGLCESQESKCFDAEWTIGDPNASGRERNDALRYYSQNCRY